MWVRLVVSWSVAAATDVLLCEHERGKKICGGGVIWKVLTVRPPWSALNGPSAAKEHFCLKGGVSPSWTKSALPDRIGAL